MRDFLSRAKFPLGGIALLGIIALLLVLAGATYAKAFRDEVFVSLRAERAGSQLNQYAPVKINGVPVGEVDSITTTGNGVTFDLALKPDMIEQIPANVSAQVVPKTLLGERYVKLVLPDDPAPRHISAGDVIGMDRTDVAIELRTVFEETLPVLQAVQPVKLNATLNAVASALQGRGDRLGDSLVQLEEYLSGLNPALDTLARDLDLLAKFTDIYADATPELLRVLDNTTFTANTIIEERATLDTFLREVTGFAGRGEEFVRSTGERIIRVNNVSRPILALLEQYSPIFPCVFAGLEKLQQRLRVVLGGAQPSLHITLELARAPKPYQYPDDLPSTGSVEQRERSLEELTEYDIQVGPRCYGLPNPPQPFPTPEEFNGSDFATELNSGVNE